MKKLLILSLATVMLLTVGGCGNADDISGEEIIPSEQNNEVSSNVSLSEDTTAAEDSSKVTVYISGPEAMISKLEGTFEKEHGDVLDMTIMSCGELRNKVWAESEVGEIRADVIWGSDPLVYNKLDEKNALEQLKLADEDSIQDQFKWEDKNYAIVNERYVAIMYNKDKVGEKVPKSYADLVNGDYKDVLTMADATQSSTAFAIAASLYQLKGENSDYFRALKDSNLMLQKSNGLVPSSIMDGQFVVGIAPQDAVVRLKNKAKKEGYEVPLEFSWPQEGIIAIQRPIAIPVSTSRSDEEEQIATEFVNFILSKPAQMITTKFGFVSVRNDIENKILSKDDNVFHVDWDYATENESVIKSEYEEIFH